MKKLIADAQKQGLRVVDKGNGAWLISTGKTNRSLGLLIFPDGTAVRADIDFSICLAIRTFKKMRNILKIRNQ